MFAISKSSYKYTEDNKNIGLELQRELKIIYILLDSDFSIITLALYHVILIPL